MTQLEDFFIARVLDSLERPTPNQAWFDNIDSRKLSQAVADMRAEQERAEQTELAEFTENYGLGVGQ